MTEGIKIVEEKQLLTAPEFGDLACQLAKLRPCFTELKYFNYYRSKA